MTLLIFDCDGVLVDSEVNANAVLAELMTSLGAPMTVADSLRIFMGKSLRDVLATAAHILGRPVPDDVGERMGDLLFARLRAELRPIDGVADAIAALPYPRCVASSSAMARIGLSLEATGLARLFEGRVFSATQVAQGKPAPDLFLFAAQAMGISPRDSIVIEDSRAGVTAALRAGMRVIGFAGAGHADAAMAAGLSAAGAHAVIDAMADLPATVERLRQPTLSAPC